MNRNQYQPQTLSEPADIGTIKLFDATVIIRITPERLVVNGEEVDIFLDSVDEVVLISACCPSLSTALQRIIGAMVDEATANGGGQ